MSIEKEKILKYIRKQFNDIPLKDIQDEIAKILQVSPATAYNKIAGRNDFTLGEFIQLSIHKNFSVDKMIHAASSNKNAPLEFIADGLEARPASFLAYFEKVMQNVLNAKPSSAKTKATFVCLQPHVFHLMKYPYLLYLKLYTYNLINWQIKSIKNYDPTGFLHDAKTQSLIKKLHNAYQSIPIVEMVGHNFIHPFCSQLEYLIKTRIIKDPDHLKQIKADMYAFLSDMEEAAAKGIKINGKGEEMPVEVYINKFIHVSNIILIESEEGDFLTIQCDVPDVLTTYNTHYIDHFKKWMESNRVYAIKISKSGGLERKEFFERNVKHVDMVMAYLEKSFKHIDSL